MKGLFVNSLNISQFTVLSRIEQIDPLARVTFIFTCLDLNNLNNTTDAIYVESDILTGPQIEDLLFQPVSAGEQESVNRFVNSREDAKAIPNWSTWTQIEWNTYFDANLSDAQADLVTSLAAARVMMKRQNLVIQNLVKFIIAMRNHLLPDLPE